MSNIDELKTARVDLVRAIREHDALKAELDSLQKEFTRQSLKLGRTEQRYWICVDALKALKQLCQNARWEDEVMRLSVESVVDVALTKIGREYLATQELQQ